jgi:hypothetical protein
MARPIRLRNVTLTLARVVLLLGPTVLAFFAGGYFDEPRNWAGLGAWVLVAVAVLTRSGRIPRSRAAWVTLLGIGLLAVWTLASIAWAPIAGSAYHAGQLVTLYAGALLAASLLLQGPSIRLWVEPVLAGGIVAVIGYGISERLLPGLLQFSHSVSAQGRLEQPLTYWNAMGELAAIGFVLCVRLSGTQERPRWMGGLAAAGCAPLGLGLYLSFSRGALFACVAGLVALVAAAPRREQIQALVSAAVVGGVAVAGAAPFGGVTSLAGPLATRERQGAITLIVLIGLAVIAGAVHVLVVRRSAGRVVRLPRRAGALALVLICCGLALAIAVGAKETTAAPRLSGGASRLISLKSNRYAYWNVALEAFSAEPVRGVGAGGWAVWWLDHRTVNDFAQDAHSLPLQTAAELGLVGLLALGMLFGGGAAALRRAHRKAPELAAGPLAALVAYTAHAPLDWDWQMPAVTLVAVVLAGFGLALAEAQPASSIASAGLTLRSFKRSTGRSIA